MATSKKPHTHQHQVEAEARCTGCGRTFWTGPGVDLPECEFCPNFGIATGRARAVAGEARP